MTRHRAQKRRPWDRNRIIPEVLELSGVRRRSAFPGADGPLGPLTPTLSRQAMGQRLAGRRRDHLRHPQGADVEGCASWLGAAQDTLQALGLLDLDGCLRAHLRRPDRRGSQSRAISGRQRRRQGTPPCRQRGAKGERLRCSGRTKRDLNSKLHAVRDRRDLPLLIQVIERQCNDHVSAALRLPHLPHDSALLADRGYDTNRFRAGLAESGSPPGSCPCQNAAVNCPTTRFSTVNATRLRSLSGASKTGGASPSATTDASTHSCQPSASRPRTLAVVVASPEPEITAERRSMRP